MPNGKSRHILYADNIGVHGDSFGINLHMGIKMPNNQVMQHTLLCISPQMAKALALMLEYHLEQIEKKIGEIKLPNEFLSSLGRDDLMQF